MALEVRLLEASRAFEVSENGSLIMSGEQDAGSYRVPGGVLGGALAPSVARPRPQTL